MISWIAPIVVDADGHWPKALRHSVGANLIGEGAIITNKTLAPASLARRDVGHAFRVAVIVVRNAAGDVRSAKQWGSIIRSFDEESRVGEWRLELPQEEGGSGDARTHAKWRALIL